ncbi:fibronectin type III domain-containing protein, partial [Paenibacillus sp. MCAF20]
GAHDVSVSGYTQAPDGTYGSFNGTELAASPNTVTVTFANGVATVNMQLNHASQQTIGFSIAGVAASSTNALSITPSASDAASMTVTTDITAPASNGGIFAQQAVVTLSDKYGNIASNDNSSMITASKKDNGAWTLTGTNTATVSGGVATFSNLGAANEAIVSGAQLAFDAVGLLQVTSGTVTLPWPVLHAPSIESVTVGNGLATIQWNEVYGATDYTVYQSTTSGIVGSAIGTSGSELSYDATGLINGTTYYFVVKASNPGGDSHNSSEASGTPRTVPAAPTDVTATAGNKKATIHFVAPTDNGGSPITRYQVSDSLGNIVGTGTSSPITVTGLKNGMEYSFTVKAINIAGGSAASDLSNAVTPFTTSSGSSPDPDESTTDVEVLVNGQVENIGTASTAEVNNQTITTIQLNRKILEDQMESEGQGVVITIPFMEESDVITGELSGQIIQALEDKQATIVIQTANASYQLPSEQINIQAVAEYFGSDVELQDIRVQIEIGASTLDQLKIVEDSAANGGFTVVIPPLNFKVTAIHGDRAYELMTFNAYIKRFISIPDGIDPNEITTGVVVEPDGTVRHVPTK